MQIDEGSMSRDELLLRLQSDNKELRKEKDKLRGDVERFCARYSSALQSRHSSFSKEARWTGSFSKQNTELVRIKEELSSKLLHSEAVKHTAEQRYADAHRVREEMVRSACRLHGLHRSCVSMPERCTGAPMALGRRSVWANADTGGRVGEQAQGAASHTRSELSKDRRA